MVGVAYGHGAEAVCLGALDGLKGGQHGERVAHTIVTVDHRNRTRINDELRRGDRFHHAVANAVEIPAEAQHAVRLVAP